MSGRDIFARMDELHEQQQEQCDKLLEEIRAVSRRLRWWIWCMAGGFAVYIIGLGLASIPIQIVAIWLFIIALLLFTD